MHHAAHDIQPSQEPNLLFGFPVLFFGTLAIAGLVAYVLHRRWGELPKVGQHRYDPIVLILGLWCLGGLLTDAFAHISGVVDDTFFTPWHAIWYSGATAYGLYITYASCQKVVYGNSCGIRSKSWVMLPLSTSQGCTASSFSASQGLAT